jgi:hypothetical protein
VEIEETHWRIKSFSRLLRIKFDFGGAQRDAKDALKNAAGFKNDKQSTAWLPDNRTLGNKNSSR